MIPIIGLKGNLSKKDSHELRCFINSTTSEFEKTEQVGCGRDVDSPLFLSPCTSTIFPISLSALMKFLDTQVLPFPQLPNNTKDK